MRRADHSLRAVVICFAAAAPAALRLSAGNDRIVTIEPPATAVAGVPEFNGSY